MKKNRNSFSKVFTAIVFCLVLFSISSCNFLMEDNIPQENESQQTETSSTSENQACALIITPSFGSDVTRSAYPEFSATQLADYTFHAVCEDAFGEVQGVYNSTTGQVTFTLYCAGFTEIVEFIVKDSEGNAVWFASKENLTFTRGGSVEITSLNFQPYTSTLGNTGTLPNGNINLSVSSPAGSKIICKIYNSTGTGTTLGESGETDKTITVSGSTNTCSITTASGIAWGEYIAKFFIYKDGTTTSTPEFRQETIVVWPGITTNAWYLSDGSKNSNLSITINYEEVKYYVKGTNPQGLYSDTGLPSVATVADASDTNAGTILAPLETINAAIAKCTSSTAKYKIICDGDFSGFNIGQASPATYNNYAITISGGGNSDTVSTIADGSAVTVYTNKAVLIENFKISNITDSTKDAITYSTNAACGLTLKNCEISNNAGLAIKTTTTLAQETKLIFMGSTYIPLTATKTNYLSLGAKCKIYVNGSLDTSNDTGGNVRTIATVEYQSHNTGTQYIFAENGANLEVERQRFRYKTYPLYFDNTGSLQISTDFYVSASATSDGDGSAENPLQTVTSALATINEINPILGGAAFTIHISGLIKEDSTISIKGSTGGSLSNFYLYSSNSSLTLCGTNKETDILDGNGSHQVLKIQGNPSYSLPVTIENLTIQNGKSSENGGGIYASYTNLKLGNGCVITKNETSMEGGAVYLNPGNLFVYGDALIGYNNASTQTTSSAAKAAGGNIAAYNGGAIYASGTNMQNTCNCYIWIGYTSENVPDASGKTPKISGNCTETDYGGGIFYNAYVSLNICKGEISYNYAKKGGGIYSYYRGYSHNERNISGVTIKGNQAQLGGGIYVTSLGNGTGAGYLHLSGTTVIEENEALGDSGMGGAIYGGGEMEIEGAVYIPFEAVKKNDVYMPSGYQLKILDTLDPPPAANGITATFTPESYDTTTVLLKDDDSGQTVNDNYSKFKVTPNGTSNWKIKSDGSIYTPYNVTVYNDNNNYTYTDKLELYNSLTNYTYSGDIEITVLEMNEEDLGPASSDYTLLNAIKSAKATRVNLIIDEEANIKLPASSNSYFSGCSKLFHVDLRGLYTSDVTNMSAMFSGSFSDSNCTYGVLDIRNFDTRNVTSMSTMFYNAGGLKTIIVGSNFSTTNVQTSSSMFYGAGNLIGGAGTTYSSSTIDYAHVDGGTSNPGYFTSVNQLPIQVTSENIEQVFANLSTGTNKIQITGTLNTNYNNAIKSALNSISDPSILIEIDFSTIDNTNYPSCPDCSGCTNITKLTMRGGGATLSAGQPKPKGAMYVGSNMFKNCTSLTTVKVIGELACDLSVPSDQTGDIYQAFDGCTNLEELDLTECTSIFIHGVFFANNGYGSTLKLIKYGLPARNNITLSCTARFNASGFKIYFEGNGGGSTWGEPNMEGSDSDQLNGLLIDSVTGTQHTYNTSTGSWN